MELEQHLKFKEIYLSVINFINDTSEDENEYNSLISYLESQRIHKDHVILSFLLNLISKMSGYHHRSFNFQNKIEMILLYLENDIREYYSNKEIFHLFVNNKNILIFLIAHKLLVVDEYIFDYYREQINQNDDIFFFIPEMATFFENDKKLMKKKNNLLKSNPNIFDLYEEKRQIGENDSHICQLIRDDLIDEFIIYVNQCNIPLESYIKHSFYETHAFLLKKRVTLIEYAAFFGSIQIYQFLRLNNVSLNPTLWFYAIHSNNAELFHLLGENEVDVPGFSYIECFIESIKCHHNDIAEYILNNLIDQDDLNGKINKEYFSSISTFYNYYFMELPSDIPSLISAPDSKNKISMLDLCFPLSTFSIPSSVTTIGPNAFRYCSSLKNIIIPSSVSSIGDGAFYGCSSLKQISIPNNVTSLGNSIFNGCTSLEEISIPETVTSIGDKAFMNCSSLIRISIPPTVSTIGDQAFMGCFSLTEFDVPPLVTWLSKELFKNCISLNHVSIRSRVKKIMKHVFFGCISLKEISSQYQIIIASFNYPKIGLTQDIIFKIE